MSKQAYLILFCCLCLVACGGKRSTKPTPAPVPPIATTKPPVSSPVPSTPPASTPQTTAPSTPPPSQPGGYYLDDGPDANPPQDLDNIPNATPKKEPLFSRSNKPYKALGAKYTPMTSYKPYTAKGVASWYGKRFHGKKTSSGEVYNMYGMSAAHTILPLPSYVKVTNPANGRSVIVRVNDRGPFKHNREIDLSYAAAHKLRFISKGSTIVEVEAIDTNNLSSYTEPAIVQEPVVTTAALEVPAAIAKTAPEASPVLAPSPNTQTDTNTQYIEYFIQAGAFKNEANADALIKKIQGLDIDQNAGINKVYNGSLHRLRLGPYESKQAAEQVAFSIRKQLNIPTIITNQ